MRLYVSDWCEAFELPRISANVTGLSLMCTESVHGNTVLIE